MNNLINTLSAIAIAILIVLSTTAISYGIVEALNKSSKQKSEQLNALKIKGDTLYLLQEDSLKVKTYIEIK